jgi:chromate transporter
LKLLAVVVVADAAWGMYKNFCKNNVSATICVMTAIALLLMPSIGTQIFVLLIAGLLGVKCLSGGSGQSTSSFKLSLKPIILFIILLFGLPLVAWANPIVDIFSDFFQAGSLVFGGGHVVLPLLQNIVGEQLSQDAFLTGYAAAQAVPGPMFTFATYLGYELLPQTPIIGALVATLAVFLPGFLLLVGVLNNWQALAQHPIVAGALNGVNASVVGLLIAALYQPVFVSAVFNAADISLILLGAILMKQFKLPIVSMVVFFVGAGLLSPLMQI